MLRHTTHCIAIAVMLGLIGSACAGEVTQAPSVAPEALQAQREAGTAPAIIDVRSAEEFATGHIPGALNIPFDQIAARIAEVDAPQGVALYCMIGPRARKGEAALAAAGYDADVLHIEGGLAAWQAAGLPVER